jgi:hypothetical protein
MSFHELGIPVSESTVSLTAFDVVTSPRAVRFPARTLMRPVPAGHDVLHFPVFAFLIEHRASGARILFDLGPRKDLLNGCPAIAAALRNGSVVMPVERDIVEQLEDAGVDVGSISAVIWRCGRLFSRCGRTAQGSRLAATRTLTTSVSTNLRSDKMQSLNSLDM